MGSQLHEAGQFDNALRHIRLGEARALAAPQGKFVCGHQLAIIAQTMGVVLMDQDRLGEARDSFLVCKERHAQSSGSGSVEAAAAALTAGEAMRRMGDSAGATQQIRAGASIFARRGWKDAEAANAHASLGVLAEDEGRLEEALEESEACIALQRQLYSMEHSRVVGTLRNLAQVLNKLGRTDEALLALRSRFFEIRRSQTHCAGLKCERKQREDGAPLDQCAGCLCTYYCSVACPTADWKAGHKAECKGLVAAEWRAAAVMERLTGSKKAT